MPGQSTSPKKDNWELYQGELRQRKTQRREYLTSDSVYASQKALEAVIIHMCIRRKSWVKSIVTQGHFQG